ncbi:MAG: glycogen debranching protein [Nitrospira sp.]|nr:glycogen debranching protein [Nitrospira sp.]MBH0183183.1 glycogen debranching protein [Nitrospira sp.]MBH0186051.1 glycogen debranching protein [Nitrospira sp.]
MKIGKADCQDLNRALSLEWLETNGRGGFASGTVAGANTRRYHALLLVARKPPADRLVLVNHLDEWIDCDGRSIPLSTNLYPGTVHPSGYVACTEFSSTPWPRWSFDCGEAVIQREIFCVLGRELVIVRWKLVGAKDCSVLLRVRPMLSGRDYHMTHHENGSLSTNASIGPARVVWQPYSDVPAVQAVHSGTYRHEPDWFRRVQFPVEHQRGLDCEEDWWSPGEFGFELEPGKDQMLVLTSEAVDHLDTAVLAKRETTRRKRFNPANRTADPLASALQQAAGAYLSERGVGQTVIAGYPWFTDWGRDTFISLPGLCLVTGQHETAWHIIESFSAHVSEGMVPNRFPDAGEQPEYNTIDASLWFIHAIGRYLAYSHDEARVLATAWPAVQEIINGYRRGTRYNIHMDHDGLITGGTSGMQLTWMDARVGDWVVTPRHGKPVEIQALWIRSLEVGADLATRFGDVAYAARCREERAQAIQSFRAKFCYEEGGYLYDVIDGPSGSDASIRPNQLFALSLCDELVTKELAASILHVIHEHLLTPVGLRTLSPKDSRYRPRYDGGVVERDGAYHQGTVWPFLLGPFITAWLAVFGKTDKTKIQARSFLNGLEAHLGEACMGQVSEVFDGDAPHHPRGCPAQAWSVAEPLRAMIEDLGVTIAQNTTRSRRVTIRSRKETQGPAVSETKIPIARNRPQ